MVWQSEHILNRSDGTDEVLKEATELVQTDKSHDGDQGAAKESVGDELTGAEARKTALVRWLIRNAFLTSVRGQGRSLMDTEETLFRVPRKTGRSCANREAKKNQRIDLDLTDPGTEIETRLRGFSNHPYSVRDIKTSLTKTKPNMLSTFESLIIFLMLRRVLKR